MSDCSDLQNQLNSIAAKIDRLLNDRAATNTEIDKLKGEIISLKQLVSSADSKASNALSSINPLEIKAAKAFDLAMGHESEIDNLWAQLAAIGASVAVAVGLARAAMAWIGGIGAALAGLAPLVPAILAAVAAVGALGLSIAAIQSRIDAIERYLDSVAAAATDAASKAIGALSLAGLAKQIGDAASYVANLAIDSASRANRMASTALDRSFLATETANIASRKADSAVGTANTAKRRADEAIGTANAANQKADSAIGTANTAKRRADEAIDVATIANSRADSAIGTAKGALGESRRAIGIAQPLPPQIEDLYRRLGALTPATPATPNSPPGLTPPQLEQVRATAAAAAAGVAATNQALSNVRSQVNQITIDMERLQNGTYVPGRLIGDPLVTQSDNDRKLAQIKQEIQYNNNNQNQNDNENKQRIQNLILLQQQCCNKEPEQVQTVPLTVPQFLNCGKDGKTPTFGTVTINVRKEDVEATRLQFIQNSQMLAGQCKECDAVVAVPDHWYYRSGGDVPQLVYLYREKLANGGVGSKNKTLTIPHPTDAAIANPPKLPDYVKGNWEGIYRLSDNHPVIINARDRQEVIRVWEFIKPLIRPEYTAKFLKKICEREGQSTFQTVEVTAWAVDYFSKGQKDNLPRDKRKKFS